MMVTMRDIGKILGCFWYTTANIVTPRYTTLDTVIPSVILIPLGVDGTLYCAIYACDDFVKLSDLSGCPIVTFNMLNGNKIYIIPVMDIIRPMVVVSN